uniref:Uncharacterized protein n=1 Tax=Melopsittacus undulatus TaxID=13146 RepID=A0A8V5GT71_MELUD
GRGLRPHPLPAGSGALRSVFPRHPRLFADTFPVLQSYRLFGRVLRIRQQHGPGMGMAANVWEAALALARFLEREHFDFRGLSVIELGAGTGILGILAAMLGADVTITDLPEALAQIRTNVRLNFPCPRSRPRVRRLRWGQDESSFPGDGHLLLGSDLVYDRSSSAALLAALRSLCGPRSRALLSARSRGGEGGSRSFFRRVLPRFFRVQLVGQEEENEIEIYGVTPKGHRVSNALGKKGGGGRVGL